MNLRDFFSHGSAEWLKYESYEYRETKDGVLYIVSTRDTKATFYKPLENAAQIVADAVNIGLASMHHEDEEVLREQVLDFVNHYGFLGLMTALSTTPQFIDYEKVYLPTNHFIKEESLATEDYLDYFFPFDAPDFHKKGKEFILNVTDRTEIAITLTTEKEPRAVTMSFLRSYAERYDWLITEFRDLAFTLSSSHLFYHSTGELDEDERNLYRQGIAAFGGIAPTYRIQFSDTPVIVWDFHSLLLILQMLLSFMLADDNPTLKICRKCGKAFLPVRKNNEFCSMRCKNQYNVYKTRAKKKDE